MGQGGNFYSGVVALNRQAADLVLAYRQALAAAGLGFTPEDRAAIAAAAAANPAPSIEPSAADVAAAQSVQQAAMTAVFPPEGLAFDDPRLAPINGIPLVAYATTSAAIGWATDDEALVARVLGALGLDRAAWEEAGPGWRARIQADVVLATFYGQLFVLAMSDDPTWLQRQVQGLGFNQ
jgi:hypothetical protein